MGAQPNGKTSTPKIMFPHCSQIVTRYRSRKCIRYGFTAAATAYCSRCITCLKYNIAPTMKITRGHHPPPQGPFEHVMMDFIQLDKCRGYEYCLVLVDMFSKWPECYPVKHANALSVAKALLKDLVCRWGAPKRLSSDNGAHFVNKIIKLLSDKLQIDLRIHCAYHPESVGAVERLNGMIKSKLAKITTSTGLDWVSALPLVLLHLRARATRSTGLSPFEILTARPMAIPSLPYPPNLENVDGAIASYMRGLISAFSSLSQQVQSALPQSFQTAHPVEPGAWVLLKDLRRKHWNQERWRGPYEVILSTPTAVRIAERDTWVHLSHCRLVKDPDHYVN